MEIVNETKDTKGRFVAMEDDMELGEMTYSIANKDLIIVDHTGVNDEARGKGIGRALFLHLVDYLRTNEIKVIPLCPFAKLMFDKHHEMTDVVR
ncbi:GNAT family N-acetyltransferase [Marinigracilibium pacificum]|uniref:N-acetyltransferase n=1 Tax=Marinigracilibium pacificum TaxID=2729599 RepID=A0A848IY89_9BACT|nr:GNAT family N-acetyltransferase [Marinigracilibium pacificum]NMM48291.1 N-acetyltransferase [Marinigracilibium pacificum]